MLTLNEIKNAKFEKSAMGGYRADDVNDFVENVTETVEALAKEVTDLKKKMQILAEKVQQYREDEDNLRAALVGAQRLANETMKEANSKAEAVVKEAEERARLLTESAERRIENERHSLARAQKDVSDFKKKIINLYQNQIRMISALPDYDGKDYSTPVPMPQMTVPVPKAEEEAEAEE